MTAADGDRPPLRPVAEGRYTDFFPVGRGGMGIVYWALDTELSRQVAFKISGAPTPDTPDGATPDAPLELSTPDRESPQSASFDGARLRFLQEAWITGGMDHPGIVPVYELGETAGGVPYYTMRFVRGNRTLRTAIEELAGEPVARRIEHLLEPFLKVCDTVRYAHNRGVIHRDLKPENVALGEFGEVILLDWGLARVKGTLDVREDPWSDRVQDLRRGGDLKTVASALGTPGYMSPEAARGETDELDERSDVYSLGVMLFQVLVGDLPFAFTTAEEYRSQVLTRPTPDPAARTEGVPARLAAICRGALAVNAADRPESADAFAESIRHWRGEAARDREIEVHLEQATAALATAKGLGGEDLLRELDRVTAGCGRVLDLRPDEPQALDLLRQSGSLRERGIQGRERQARRRTLSRVGAAVLVVAVVAAIVVASVLEARRKEAADARARAEDVMQFMVFELQEALEPIGRLDVLAKIGATAQAYYATLPSEGLSRESLVGHTVTLRRLGEVAEARGDLPAAQEAYRLGGAVAERILELDAGDRVGHYHRSIADARVARVLFRQGRSSDARRMFLEHREDVVRQVEDEPEDTEYRAALVDAHAMVGQAMQSERRWDEALEAMRLALETARGLERDHPTEERWARVRLECRVDEATLHLKAGRTAEAVRMAEQTLELCRHLRNDPSRATDVRWSTLEAVCLFRRARNAAHHGSLDDAPWAEAYEASDRLHRLDPENAAHRARLALIQNFRGEACTLRGDHEGALAHASASYDLCEALTRQDPTNANWLNSLVTLCDRMATTGTLLHRGVEHDRAYRRKAEEHARHLVELDPADPTWRHIHAYTLGQLGRTWREDDPDEARRLLERCRAIVTELVEPHPSSYELVVLQSFTRAHLAALHRQAGRRADCHQELRASVDELSTWWARHPGRYEVLSHLLSAYRSLATDLSLGTKEDRVEAVSVLREGIALAERTLEATDEGDVLTRGKIDDALALMRPALRELTADEEAPR